MRKGFTIIELMVASLLLAMLVTILTSIFNQSSIAWRTGTAGVTDMDAVRDTMAEVREEADNAFVYNKEVYALTGLWDENGELRQRACDVDEQRRTRILADKIQGSIDPATGRPVAWTSNRNVFSVGSAANIQNASRDTYTVNVKSAGPDKKFNTYDDIWSFPDEYEL